METYKTVREAGIAGTREAIRLALRDSWEYGGLILRQGNEFIVAGPITDKDIGSIDSSRLLPGGLDMAGIRKLVAGAYHVHVAADDAGKDSWPAKHNSSYLSGNDVASGLQLMVPVYLGYTGTGKIFETDFTSRETLKRTTVDSLNLFNECPKCIDPVAVLIGLQVPFAVRGTEVYAGDDHVA